MGKKKSFIDKKQATTFNLVYRSGGQEDAPGDGSASVLMPADRVAQLPRLDRENTDANLQPEDHLAFARSFFHDEVDEISEERRREILTSGFPDDGYDYLKHLRVLGKGKASLEGLAEQQSSDQDIAGPSVFVPAVELLPPPEDVQIIDAAHLVVRNLAPEGDQVEEFSREVSAYARTAHHLHRSAQQEVQELQKSMQELENASDNAEPDYGDWLDEFVVAASQRKPTDEDQLAHASDSIPDDESGSGSWTDVETGDEEEEDEDDDEQDVDLHRATPSSRAPPSQGAPRSIASTYWRPERHDRSSNLSTVDLRFDRLALQYEDDELGELADDDPTTRAAAGPGEVLVQRALDDFLADHPKPPASCSGSESDGSELEEITDDECEEGPGTRGQQGETSGAGAAPQHAPGQQRGGKGLGYRAGLGPGADGEVLLSGQDRELVQLTKARAKALLAKAESAQPEPEAYVEVVQEEQWDCESVLSLLSNRENHPGRIGEPRRPPRPAAAGASGLIILSNKTGLPVMPTTAGPTKKEPVAGLAAPTAAAPPTVRPKDETPEERRLRKAAVKEARRDTRAAKKELKVMFKDEGKRQKRQLAAAPPSASMIAIP